MKNSFVFQNIEISFLFIHVYQLSFMLFFFYDFRWSMRTRYSRTGTLHRFWKIEGGADWLKMKILSRGGEGGALHLKLNFSLSLQFLTCSQKIWGATPSLFTFLYVKRKMFAARKSGGVEAPCPLMLRACWRTLSSSVPLVDCVF